MSSTTSGSRNQSQHHQPTRPKAPSSKASSVDTGYFQETPRLKNQFKDDVAIQRILSLYLSPVLLKPLHKELDSLASTALSPKVLTWLRDAETNPPTLESHDAFANRNENLRTSVGWRKLSELGAHEGIVAEGYEGRYGRIGQFAKYYILSPSSAITTCPFAMTDGAARLLAQQIPKAPSSTQGKVFANAHFRLISRDQSTRWTSGQWMTERPPGSEVGRRETIAVYSPLAEPTNFDDVDELGPWIIDGYKYITSATDADMTILLARTASGLSAFYAPTRLPNGDRNGIKVVRLKKSTGTMALPTAELELNGMRAWLIGAEGDGIREISTVLNVSRIHNSVTAVSFMRRGLAIAKAYAKARVVAKNRPLWTMPLHLRTLAGLELLHRASTHLTFLTVHLLSVIEDSASPTSINSSGYLYVPSSASAIQLFRILTPMTKALTARLAMITLSESVESLGGIGPNETEEPMNIARLLRDTQVLSIWEGTTNVLITDLISVLKRTSRAGGEGRSWEVINEFVEENLGRGGRAGEAGEILERCKVVLWKEWKEFESILDTRSKEELTRSGRAVLWRLGWVICGVLLIMDARRDGDRVATDLAKRWILERGGIWGWDDDRGNEEEERRVEDRTGDDCLVVFGEELPTGAEGRPKL
ncbi:uncharacterized protein LAJ45_04026 [Morchella importuna]|uniref:Acyl-CoA dehydrogenase/oxidase C-terminal n=1 Tax=Morchella conica CCBAS932 TaxID=1392247 RepID=A0A3N4L4V4_9PEZI|nr:uncharacterized protein LAJ45_04026 [Morchella importuna]KAH8152032.1 hypothetical protein LAJ45_04026 [Morchella importuna]RPB16532.1 acyl-CoA dehydrogenase/oxidase C-terminal [Morchella conica CCBAS932]